MLRSNISNFIIIYAVNCFCKLIKNLSRSRCTFTCSTMKIAYVIILMYMCVCSVNIKFICQTAPLYLSYLPFTQPKERIILCHRKNSIAIENRMMIRTYICQNAFLSSFYWWNGIPLRRPSP